MAFLNMMCRVNYKESELIEIMEDRIIITGTNWFIPKFIKFQYSTLLSAKPAIISVVKDIFNYNLKEMIPESFGNDYLIKEKSFDNHCKMIKDKDKVKDMVKDKVNNTRTEKILGIEFLENKFVLFSDNTKQLLGKSQLGRLTMNDITPREIIKGQIH